MWYIGSLAGTNNAIEVIDGYHDVPTADTFNNTLMRDVIGNKDDNTLAAPGNDSLYGIAGFMAYYHVHDGAKVYPSLADPINIATAAAAWTYGSWVEIVPTSGIIEAFDIHWVHVADISANDNFELQLGAGGVGSESPIGTVAFSRDSNAVQVASIPIQIPPQLANTRISVRVAGQSTSSRNMDVKIYYHVYPS